MTLDQQDDGKWRVIRDDGRVIAFDLSEKEAFSYVSPDEKVTVTTKQGRPARVYVRQDRLAFVGSGYDENPPKAPEPQPATIIPVGSLITCENGHAVCQTAKAIAKVSPRLLPFALTEWVQPEPALGADAPPCTECGALWVRALIEPWEVVYQLHIDGMGWAP